MIRLSKHVWLTLLALVVSAGTAMAQGTIGGYQIVGNVAAAGGARDVSYRAVLTNTGGAIQTATATILTASGTTVVDGTLTFGPIAAGGTAVSQDTFTLRQLRSSRPPITWNVVTVPVGGGGTAQALRIRPVANVQAGGLFLVVVDAVDASNVIDPSFNGQVNLVNLQSAVTANGQTAFGGTVSATAAAGTATFPVFVNNAADGYTFSAQTTLSGVAIIDTVDAPFNVTATHLTVTTAIANRQAGNPFGVTVEGRDANNALAENFAGTVSLNAGTTGGSNFVGGAKNLAATAGTATFAGLALTNAADNYTVTASAAALTNGVSNAFNVTFSTLTVQPLGSVQAGALFNAVVQARDADGNPAENFGAGNALTLVNLQAAVVANGQTAFNAPAVPVFGAGQGSLSVSISNAANGYTFSAQAMSSGNVVTDASDAFDVTASHLTVTTAIANRQAGNPFGVTVEARDANNAVAENFAGTVSLNAATTGGSNFAGGTKNLAAAAGTATFVNLTLTNAADTYTVTASSPALTNGVSNAFNVSFSTLTVQPLGSVQAGALFNAVVQARDADGNPAENFGAGNALTLVNLQAAVVANGQTAFNAPAVPVFGAGLGSFSVSINNAANGYTFSAQATSSGTLVTDASDAFDVTASHLAITTAVTNRQAGNPFGVTVEARDANNAVAENFAGTVSLNAGTTGGSNFVGGTKNLAAAAGTATFAGLTLNNAADTYTVTASSPALTNGVSNSFNVTFSTLTVLPVPNVVAGTLVGIGVQARDADGVLAENFSASSGLTLTNLRASVVANGQTAFDSPGIPTFAGGEASYGLFISNAANGYTFSAQATSSGTLVTDALDAGFNVAARRLAVTTAIANQTAGTPFAVTVEARDANDALAENFTGNVSLNAAASGGANFQGGTQVAAALNGVANFLGLVLGTGADGYTVTASAAGVTNGVSNAFNVAGNGGGEGEADSLELDLSQSTVGAGGAIAITATVRDGLGEVISPAPLVVYQILADEGSTGSAPAVVGTQITTSSDTRGGFILVGTVNGTAVTDEVLFAVTQTAAESKNAAKFLTLAAAEGTVGLKLDELSAAFDSGNLAAIPAINAALQAARNTVLLTGRNAVQRGTPVTPEVGFLPSIAQLNAAGLTETAADQAFRLLIPQIVTKLNQIRAFYDTLPTNPAAGGADSVAALNQLNADLAALQSQLESLDITPHAIVRNATALNNLIRDTMPRHLHSVAGKISGVLTSNTLTSLEASPAEFFAGGAPALVSPAEFYGQPQPTFFGFAGLFAGSSLQMNLVNRIYGPIMAQVSRMMVLLAADALLQDYLNTANFEGIITGGSLSFFTFNAFDSVIEGTGMNRENVASNEVFLIGGAAIQAVQNVITSFNPSNVDSLDDVYDYFEGIVNALQGAGQAYDQAEQPPASVEIGCILDGGSNSGCSQLVYPAGFESVSGCSGIFCFQFPVLILYHNKDTGHWASGLFNFVPE